MEEIHYEAVKALVEQWDYDWGCGPFEDCLPEEDEVRKLNDWTGRSWTAEDVRLACFEYASHNSLEETIYFLFHGAYPPVTTTELVFYSSVYQTEHQRKPLSPIAEGAQGRQPGGDRQALPVLRSHLRRFEPGHCPALPAQARQCPHRQRL